MRSSTDLSASWHRRWRVLAMLLLCLIAGAIHAQDTAGDASDDSADPPSRVARLSYISGDLGFLPAGASDWSDASVNRPLTTGDRLSTGQGSRAELELGGGTLRMDGRTEFGVLALNDQAAQFELTSGTLDITVRNLDQGQSYEIDTPTVALVIDQPGSFRVDIDDDGGSSSTRVSAFDGRATVYGENNAQRDVLAGRAYRFVDSSLAAVSISDLGGGDAFDAWSSERDNSYARSTASQYVDDDVVGYQDLDQYGDWQDTADYGEVWFPTGVAADWAPYRDGHWAYIAPWGWTWVDNLPWGFAPYHYGRWAYVHGGWGWIPGPRGVRAVYAPALVAFVGGGGWSVGVGGPVGWFPLGPGEIYNPWYRCGRGCYTRVNFNNLRARRGEDRARFVEHIHDHYNHFRSGAPGRNDHYANRNAPRGFTAVPAQAFAGGRNLRHDALHVDQHQLATASVLTRGVNVRPAAGAVAGPRSPHARALPPGGFQREVVTRHTLTGSTAGAPSVRGSNRPESFTRNLPSTPNIRSAVPADAGHQALDHRGAFPSSRFAHPQPGRADAAAPLHTGEGYISGAGNNRMRETYRGPSTLPQAPQIQRAETQRQPTPEVNREQRFEPRDRAPRNDVMRMPERPAYQPQRQNFQPRYEPQREAPSFRQQPHAESHEQRSAPAHEAHSENRSSNHRDDSRGH